MKALKASILASLLVQIPVSIAQSLRPEGVDVPRDYHVVNHGLNSHQQKVQQESSHPTLVVEGLGLHPPHISQHETLAFDFFTLPDAKEAAIQDYNKMSKKRAVHDWMISPASPRHSSKRGRSKPSSSSPSSESSSRKVDMSRISNAIRNKKVPTSTRSSVTAPSSSSSTSSSSSSTSRSEKSLSFDLSQAKEQ
ncbi:unnamed protein product [Cylindrotheca closterium]|uniref:Uncharacterized protein n=1 Tax=Cylindrotheca closterium TaxID=2856 RepID=A0AAD2JLG0_9STRA|nr:unnamed protein product [Cylindrotheca closterium]